MSTLSDLNKPFAPYDKQLAHAEESLRALAATRNDRWYPLTHIASESGWINDPNGLSFFKGRWHVFYQLHPFGTEWGPMHWGHVSSADLVTWRREPVALAPSIEAERAGVFSGSAAVGDDGRLYVYYTGHRRQNGTDSKMGNLEVQCLATSEDGVRFEKHGVIIENPENLIDFRDPKVWKQNGTWYMVFGQRSAENRGQIVLYRSHDMVSWEFERVLYQHPDEHVYMLECPDFYPLTAPDGSEKWIMCFSAMGAKKSGYLNRNKNNAGYVIGTWEPGSAFTPETEHRLWDWGHNFYAPQSLAAPDGRRLMLGWMSPADTVPSQQDGWCGQMTLPREVTLGADGDVHTVPACELAVLRMDAIEHGPTDLGSDREQLICADAEAVEIELVIDLAHTTAERAGLKVHATHDGGYVYVAYDDQTGRVVLDRQAVRLGERGYRAAPLSAEELATGRLELRVFIDRGSVEVYVNGGRQAMSAYSFPTAGKREVRLVSEAGSLEVERLTVHHLSSIGLA